jgi:hypothetical protein
MFWPAEVWDRRPASGHGFLDRAPGSWSGCGGFRVAGGNRPGASGPHTRSVGSINPLGPLSGGCRKRMGSAASGARRLVPARRSLSAESPTREGTGRHDRWPSGRAKAREVARRLAGSSRLAEPQGPPRRIDPCEAAPMTSGTPHPRSQRLRARRVTEYFGAPGGNAGFPRGISPTKLSRRGSYDRTGSVRRIGRSSSAPGAASQDSVDRRQFAHDRMSVIRPVEMDSTHGLARCRNR